MSITLEIAGLEDALNAAGEIELEFAGTVISGPPGPKGDPGEVGDLSLIVEMLPSASPPSVVKTGTPDAPVFTLGIPRSDIQTFMQTLDTSATEWTVSHMLGRFPNVQVMDSAGSIIFVNVTHIDANTTAISYNAAFVGKATFS